MLAGPRRKQRNAQNSRPQAGALAGERETRIQTAADFGFAFTRSRVINLKGKTFKNRWVTIPNWPHQTLTIEGSAEAVAVPVPCCWPTAA